jgi:hypothetical protein
VLPNYRLFETAPPPKKLSLLRKWTWQNYIVLAAFSLNLVPLEVIVRLRDVFHIILPSAVQCLLIGTPLMVYAVYVCVREFRIRLCMSIVVRARTQFEGDVGSLLVLSRSRMGDGEFRTWVRDRLIEAIEESTREQYESLSSGEKRDLLSRLHPPDYEVRATKPLILAVVKLVEKYGGRSVCPHVRALASGAGAGRDNRIREVAKGCLSTLEGRMQHAELRESLLRTEVPWTDELLRPATGTVGHVDGGTGSLRASTGPSLQSQDGPS